MLRGDDADETCRYETAGECRLVHQYEDVERVAITALGGRDEAEVEWEARAGGEDALETEEPEFLIVGELVAAPGDGLDNCVEVARFFVERGERGGVVLTSAYRHARERARESDQ